jgi:hypothetical protein
MASLAEQMAILFQGSDVAHGQFIPEKSSEGKQKGRAETKKEPTTLYHWQSHLDGTVGLGIIPIREDTSCGWAAIDVDIYPLNFVELLLKVKKNALPLVACKSKSGGAHLYLFLKRPLEAADVIKYLRNATSKLGIGGTEIFPKQSKVLTERGDVGNWLNMPYFGPTRQCIVLDQSNSVKELSLSEFLAFANSSSVGSLSDLGVDLSGSPIIEGPPCLQVLSIDGFPPHTRNNGLFALGVYAKKAFPDKWKEIVEGYNRDLFKPSLSSGEVSTVIASLDKKEYYYRCHEEPMVSFCNSQLCRTRKFGISTIANMPIINSVTKLTAGDSAVWFLDVEGGRLELTSDELFDNKKFQVKCLELLNILPYKMNAVQWTSYLQKLVDQAIIIKEEHNLSAKEQLWELYIQYVKSRITGNPFEIDNGRTYYEPQNKEIWFKLKEFLTFLQRKRFTLNKTLIISYLKDRGLMTDVKTFNKKSVRFYRIGFEETIEEITQMFREEEKDVI